MWENESKPCPVLGWRLREGRSSLRKLAGQVIWNQQEVALGRGASVNRLFLPTIQVCGTQEHRPGILKNS